MQDEVDEPAAFLDYETGFRPQNALIPRRPWLGPHLPIILPPSNIVHVTTNHPETSKSVHTNPDTDDECPDHIIIPDSDSSSMSQIRFPVSDSDSNDPMDVVRSDGQSAQPHGAEFDTEIHTTTGHTDLESDSSIPDHIILPDDFSRSEDRLLSSGRSGVMAGFQASSVILTQVALQLVIVTGFETCVGLRVGYTGYGSRLDFVNPQCTRTLGMGSPLPVL